ncbi:hypothetical protein RhiirA5_430232 [Rhizophagus irregularis]|uniref:Mutator-like transposase domain-containing protein n=2 Tax=Rhizophagus irregularis TaxID=588596 RepID=A0A2N0NX32_9GLOM|nr:hypothetical protein RhiirA5_430232 [Rhizophagus irregularis]
MATKGKKREKIPDWVQYMQACSPALKIFKRANGGYMLRDTFRPLEVLSIHAELQTNRNYCFNPYYHAITKKENIPTPPWVPLLPDHCVIGKFGSLYVRLEIQSNNEEHLIYCWKIYKNMEMTQLIHWEANSDFFVSMRKYIKQSGEISIPDILRLRDPSIIHDLQSKVNSIYPNLFNANAINSQNKINKLTTAMQKKGKKLLEKASAISHPPIIYHGIEIKKPGMHLSPDRSNFSACTGAGLVGGVNRQQLQTIFSIIGITAQSSKGHYHSKQNEYLEKINKEAEISAQIALSKAIAHIKAKGERVLPTSFDCSWSHCQNANQASGELIFQGNLDGYNHKPVIAFATSEKPRKLKKKNGEEYEVFHGNHEKTSRQMEHAILLQIIEKIVPILEAADVLLDIGVDGDLNSNKTLNNISCVSKVYADLKHVGKNIRAKIAKSSMWKDYENTIMTYYNSCVYAASGRKLDENKITVSDAELEKVQIDGLVAHLSDDHSLCWDEVCWRKDNPDIQLKAPHLKEYTPNQREKFRQFLKECFYISTKQSLITHIRTFYNEAFN